MAAKPVAPPNMPQIVVELLPPATRFKLEAG